MCSRTRRLIVLAAIAGVAAAGAVASAQSRKVLAELGTLDPPAYAAPLDRKGVGSPVFDDAMTAYESRRFERAADVLRRFVTVEPDDPAGNFFLAVSLMMTDDVGEAEDRLGVIIDSGSTPFELPARFVRAKAWIRLGKLDAAEEELERVARSTDAFARRAADLLPKVRAQKKRK
jgi:predicted Zn-dependent protease